MMKRNGTFYVSRSTLLSAIILVSLSMIGALEYTALELLGNNLLLVVIFEIVVAVFLVFVQKYRIGRLVTLNTLIILAIITYYKSGIPNFILLIIIAIAFSSMEYKMGFKLIFISRALCFAGIIVLSLMGVLENKIIIIDKINRIFPVYTLGYSHPNRLAFSFVYLSLIFFCYKNTNISKRNCVITFIINILFFLISGSRTSFVVILGFIILVYVLQFKEKLSVYLKKFLFVFSIPLFLLSLIFSMVIPIMYNIRRSKILVAINLLIQNRISYAAKAFSMYDVTLFGGMTNFSKLLTISGVVDNSYVRFLFMFGYFGIGCLALFSILTLVKLLKKGEYIYIVVILMMSLWAISENVLCSFSFNIIAIFWGEIIRKENDLGKLTAKS